MNNLGDYNSPNLEIKIEHTQDFENSESTSTTATIVPNTTNIPSTASPTATMTAVPFEPLVISAPNCNYGGSFRSIEAEDRYTVVFHLCTPDPALLSKIAFPTFGIQPMAWLEQAGSGPGNPLLEKPIGTGPYQIEQWLRGEKLIFNAYDQYWGGAQPGNQTLVFRWELDEVQRLLELQAGLADGVNNVHSVDFSIVREDPDLNLILRPAMNVSYIGINSGLAPFDNEKLRQALAMGIDRQNIVEGYFPEGYQLAWYFTPCSIPNACAGEPWYDYDPEMAKQLLAEAGFPNGFQTKLIYQDVLRGYLPRPGQVAQAIREQLRDNLNIDARIEEMDTALFYQSLDAGLLPGLHLLGWGADYPDISNFLDFHFGSNATGQFGPQFEDIGRFLEQGSASVDDQVRRPFYEKANNAIRQHVPMIPLAQGGWISAHDLAVAYSNAVEGAYASPLGIEYFWLISVPGVDTFTWLQGAEPISLYCADETDLDSLRACAQVVETLYRYEAGSVTLQPALAKACEASQDLLEWRCTLNEDVHFHDGSTLDANDVVYSFWLQWDATHPMHKGNTGEFQFFRAFFGNLLNESNP